MVGISWGFLDILKFQFYSDECVWSRGGLRASVCSSVFLGGYQWLALSLWNIYQPVLCLNDRVRIPRLVMKPGREEEGEKKKEKEKKNGLLREERRGDEKKKRHRQSRRQRLSWVRGAEGWQGITFLGKQHRIMPSTLFNSESLPKHSARPSPATSATHVRARTAHPSPAPSPSPTRSFLCFYN